MPDEPKANGSGTHETAAIVTAAPPAEPFFEDDDDLTEDLLDQDDEDDGAEPFALDFSVPEAFDDEDDFDDLDDDDDVVPAAAPLADDERIAKLEAAARDLAAADVDRHNRRVRRKVSAATTGA